jgi:hypothetical protein
MISCGDSSDIVCRSLPGDVRAATPVPVSNVDNFALIYLRTQPPIGAVRQADCRVGYEFAVTGIADLLRAENDQDGVVLTAEGAAERIKDVFEKYFSVTADSSGAQIHALQEAREGGGKVNGSVLIVMVSIPQPVRSGTYEAKFQHPDGRVLRTEFQHFGFRD